MDTGVDEENVPAAVARREQEREIAISHALTSAEFALARDAAIVGLMLARAGIDFDPRTFIALRIMEGSVDGSVDPVECLELMQARGVLERTVAMAADLLTDDV